MKKRCDNLLQSVSKKFLKIGLLIAIEGIDGAGKTTQTKFLKNRLVAEGYSVITLKEPTNSKWGKKIEELAKNGRDKVSAETELEYFMFDRIEDVKENILPSLNSKKIVIMDRYYYSSVCYQGARGLNLDNIEKKNIKIAPVPAITFIIDIDADTAIRRIKKSRDEIPNHFEKKKYLEIVRSNFLNQYGSRPEVKVIKGTQPIDKVSSELWDIIYPIIKNLEE